MSFNPVSVNRFVGYNRPTILPWRSDSCECINIAWSYYDQARSFDIDPIVELFRPLRDKLRKETDLHVVILYIPDQATEHPDGEHYAVRKYTFAYGPGERQSVSPEEIQTQFKALIPVLISDLENLLDAWSDADNGLAEFAKNRNKDSVHNFLVSVGLRRADRKKKKRGVNDPTISALAPTAENGAKATAETDPVLKS